jgi:hypothetical protein
MVLIGIDPHKATHTAVAIDKEETALGELTVKADRHQVERRRPLRRSRSGGRRRIRRCPCVDNSSVARIGVNVVETLYWIKERPSDVLFCYVIALPGVAV